ncbi:MAG: DUF3110 domain-containing protein [Oscillatoriaceae bacterium SKW80]|nr:DUF3110 domain-containing protein [Oscillatoriaceae bacterium SKYG93]MCX8120201.1 DUF3110 domain-containing protein [Oscillatoriaceae bacterium SKW80]MDW8453127.1 DUF3110 domain-containing protein [Oscillatoriaceae cyanobacterium SKYGB_i_bin93]HIK28961.1 DUF3110 domain-containing protein [Oscillatoriaceae cyanobacterium M7585_C2015_266]
MRVFVLLFKDQMGNEGIHTLKELRSQRNKVLMFESEDDATRYALMLEAQDFPKPGVEEIDEEEIIEFCRSADYDWELVPSGKLAIPPETNIEETDWQPEQSPEAQSIPESELERIRRQLEGLL